MASWFVIGYASTHLVKWSVITRMYLLLRSEMGYGPQTSIETSSKGREHSIGCIKETGET